ncbi:hypothetical protein [Paenibacillus sp. 32O-W]|uniref:hypothetical protein n=1 Tax=Paenibacillus sp. 32O-W TaxID=1695218 RepID=UPI001C93019D|nr:hypothetical protein [Paenibacillus sp. 32O-W]
MLGFGQYQLLSFHGIQRFCAIQFLTQKFMEFQRQEWMNGGTELTLGKVVHRIREESLGKVSHMLSTSLGKEILHLLKHSA